jgi:6-pyruvoyltetrahydropterin/6-carboxytetrahydropterin synthase
MDIFKQFHFEAAHHLPRVAEDHKCSRVHGHSYHVTLVISGEVKQPEGWVMDFAEIKQAFLSCQGRLDHCYLNEVPGLENPTSENLAIWIWNELKARLPALKEIRIEETCDAGCIYRGE